MYTKFFASMKEWMLSPVAGTRGRWEGIKKNQRKKQREENKDVFWYLRMRPFILQHQDWNSKLLEECLLKIPIADCLLAKKLKKL